MADDPPAPTGTPDATLSVDIAQASYYGIDKFIIEIS